MAYELVAVASPADWQAMHNIRRSVLFAPRRHDVDYDENHADDRIAENVPFLLKQEGEPIGVVRLDVRGDGTGVVRLVAIAESEQRRGHGRVLEAMIEDEARRRGVSLLKVNSAPDAVGFYERTGWQRATWDMSELVGIASDCVQMTKAL